MKKLVFLFTLFAFTSFMASCDNTNGDPIRTESGLENASNESETNGDRQENITIHKTNEFEKILQEAEDKGLELEDLPIELQEFIMNYQLLDIFYINAHTQKELDDPGVYYGKAKETLFRNYPFADVYYMFNKMSCLFTQYYDPSYYEELSQALFYSDKGSGFGMDYDTLNFTTLENAVVANVYLNGPADKAGIEVGDTLLTIDDQKASTFYITYSEADVSKKSSTFTLKRGDDTITVPVTKDEFTAPSVLINYINDIPIITITSFVDTTTLLTGTYGEFKEALKRTGDAKATIINLADNGGGSVDHCMPMAAELLPKNTVLGYTLSTDIDSSGIDYSQRIDTTVTMPQDFDITRDGLAKDRYIVFVQNGQTASCSELMISAVTTSRNAPVVGTQSYGKGIGQYYFETIAGGFSGITGCKFFDKNMKSYHSYGIQPDIIVRETRDALFKAYEIASAGTYARTAGYSTKPSGNFAAALKKSAQPGKASIRENFGAFKVKKAPNFHN